MATSTVGPSVKELMTKFSGTKSVAHTPAGFEEQKRLERQREIEARQKARELAKHYNDTLKRILSRKNVSPSPNLAKVRRRVSSTAKKSTILTHSGLAFESETLVRVPEEDIIIEPEPLAATRPPTSTGTFLVVPFPPPSEAGTFLSPVARSKPASTRSILTHSVSMTEDEFDEEEDVMTIFSKDSLGVDHGYFVIKDFIDEVVRLNRPSISDVLLQPRPDHKLSVSSVGPNCETDVPDHHRLLPGVEVDVVLRTFYELYAPEKLPDADLVLKHFKHRTEALLYALECKYFVVITPEGTVIPYNPATCPNPVGEEGDERVQARRATRAFTDVSEWTTDSWKGDLVAEDSRIGEVRRGGESEFL